MVYVNTLMLQHVLAEPQWQGRLTATDLQSVDAAYLGARQPVRPLRARYDNPLPLK